ncbi:hypothetical protein N7467_007556 [Penicillium canescens]|nr:hypothetical protein N7467_007556 [Penicillium canescens]
MDFILSLTHFCEVHGPTSIICSQVLPFSCPQCHPDSDSPQGTPAPDSRVEQPRHKEDSKSPKIEDHPYFLKGHPASPDEKSNRGGGNGDTCASCSLSLPADWSTHAATHIRIWMTTLTIFTLTPLSPESLRSASVASDASCHTHIHTYLSQRGPPKPADYALLRRSSIRTLSCELLPRGLSSGPICFGDSVAGYTIAYIFRLPDPMARGKRRSYALVALAGRDAGRAFRACPIIWRAFGRIAASIVNAAERFQEDEKTRDEQNNPGRQPGRQYTPVSSFLTGRAMDPAGRRAAGQIRARNLAEIVGNEYIFTELHAHFVALLQQLGSMFGGIPLSEERFICSTMGDDDTANPAPPVLVSATGQPKDKKFDGNDIDMSNLEIASEPKAIPIAPRRPVMA